MATEFERWWETFDKKTAAQWLAARPPIVRKLLTQYPCGTTIDLDGQKWYVFGANEAGQLIVTPADSETYEAAMDARKYLCAEHLQKGELHFEPRR